MYKWHDTCHIVLLVVGTQGSKHIWGEKFSLLYSSLTYINVTKHKNKILVQLTRKLMLQSQTVLQIIIKQIFISSHSDSPLIPHFHL